MQRLTENSIVYWSEQAQWNSLQAPDWHLLTAVDYGCYRTAAADFYYDSGCDSDADCGSDFYYRALAGCSSDLTVGYFHQRWLVGFRDDFDYSGSDYSGFVDFSVPVPDL